MGPSGPARAPLFFAVALGWLSGCTHPTVPVARVSPGPVALGTARTLVLVGGTAPRVARKAIHQELQEQAQRRGYYQIVDRGVDGWRLARDGDALQLAGSGAELGKRAVAIRIDVPVWRHSPPNASAQQARVRLRVSILAADGSVRLRDRDYEGGGEVLVSTARDVPGALQPAIEKLLDDITPVEALRDVPFDDGDSDQEEILMTAVAGSVARAHEAMRVFVEQHPRNATAAYNLAVLTEALGRYDDALDLYDRALELEPEPLYRRARDACAVSVDAATRPPR